MAKRTAIIDIGSNSARLVIFQETSKYGFHLICELKSRVRIGEGAYENHGNLQKTGMDRAFHTLQSFSQTINEFKVSTTIAVATSALRDAPNKSIFLDRVKQKLDLDIKVIDGREEALLGAIAVNNLLPIDNGVTVDIGGGSTDISLIKNSKVIDTFSLDIGTVRLKELFFDKSAPKEDAIKYISKALSDLPKSFSSESAIAIGGTARTLAKAIMSRSRYPLNKLHAFRYNFDNHNKFFEEIIDCDKDDLNKLYIKESRHDTIREGALIFTQVIKHIGSRQIITSGVGVREGVYLKHKYPKKPYTLPDNINPSTISIKDRFDILALPCGNKNSISKELYNILHHIFDKDKVYFPALDEALDLSNIGKVLTIYHKDKHASYIAMEELNYGFTHEEMILVSILLYSKLKRGYNKRMYREYKTMLPSKKIIKWLSFIYTLTLVLQRSSVKVKYSFKFNKNRLTISGNKAFYLAQEEIGEMNKPNGIEIILH